MRISDWSSDVCSSDAALVGEVNHVDAVLAQPRDPAVEVHRLAHHHRADVELPHQAAAVPARGERGDHDGVAIAALAAGLAEGVGFAVHGRVAFLYAAIVAAAEQAAVLVIERSADRDAAFGQAGAGFFDGGVRSEEHTSELQSLMRISYAVF